MKISTLITMMAASTMILCGCGESNSKPSKAELKERIVQKYSKYVQKNDIRAALGDFSSGGNASAAIIILTKRGLGDSFQADLDAYNEAE